MDIVLKIPDQVMKEDPNMQRFVRALQPLLDRMATSHFKYGALANKYPDSATGLDNAGKRIEHYKETGNTEACLDAANFLLIEHIFPSHKESHFRAESSHESPGLAYCHE